MNLGVIKKYLKVYFLLAQAAFSQTLITRFSSVIFLIGKIIRFFFSLFLIMLVAGKSKNLAGYTLYQVILFFLIFNLIDIIVQIFFRGVYWFRGTILNGSFDFYLLKPLNPLFQSLFGHPDFLDIITMVPLVIFTLNYILKHALTANIQNFFLFFLLFINGCVLALSFHIIVLAIGVLTTEVDNAIWIYRDISGMLKLPLKIYSRPIKLFLTFVLPLAVIFNFPAKALMGILSWPGIIFSYFSSFLLTVFSLKFWHFALKRYSSASS